jgi:hypothetical protein
MLSTILLLALGTGDAVAEAGAAYREAQGELKKDKYEQAVQLLRSAIQLVGEESDQLKYRDDTSRRRHAYYPYFEWGRARLLQADTENSIYNQRDLLQDAIGRLGQSRHPDAAQRLEEAKSKLKGVQEAIALDGSFNAVKTKIELLGNGDKFQEAFKALQEAQARYKGRGKELEEVRLTLTEKQAAVVKRYETMLSQRLADVVLMDPTTTGESIAPLIKPALVPTDVVEKGGAVFDWAMRFIALWEKQQDVVAKSGDLPGAPIIAAADALDAAGLEALDLKLPAGFRAARHLAQSARVGTLRGIATGSEDVLDTKTASAVVASAAGALARAAEATSRLASPETQDQLDKERAVHEKQVSDLDKKIVDGAKERMRLTAPILVAEESLSNGDTIGDPAALGKLKNDLFELESDAQFGTLTSRLRARALFAHGLAEAMLAFLEGKTPAQAVDQSRLPTWRAYGFDPKVDARWASKLSPKLLKVLDQIRPQ